MSARRKKHFCGHVGFGKFCHRCDQAKTLEAVAHAFEPGIKEAKLAEAARLRSAPRKAVAT